MRAVEAEMKVETCPRSLFRVKEDGEMRKNRFCCLFLSFFLSLPSESTTPALCASRPPDHQVHLLSVDFVSKQQISTSVEFWLPGSRESGTIVF